MADVFTGTTGAGPMTSRPIRRTCNVVWVSFYLAFIAMALMVRGRLPAAVLWRSLSGMRWFRSRFRQRLDDFSPEQGTCWVANVAGGPISDRDARSRLQLYEDKRPIGPPHSLHDDIRTLGGGRFSHWANHLYFSTPDGSDPRSNGRTYEVVEQ